MATAQWRRRQLGRRLLHVVRVTTFTSPPMDTDREFTGPGVRTLYASTDQTDIDVFVRVSLVSNSCRCPSSLAGGDRIRLEITNQDSLITDAPMTHFHGTKVGTDTYRHDRPHHSTSRPHERPRI